MRKNVSTDYAIYLSILEVSANSTKEDIRKAYLRLIKQWHPDKFPNDNLPAQEATEKSKKLNEAFEILKDYKPPEVKLSTDFKQQYSTSKSTKSEKYGITRIKVKSSNIQSIGYNTSLKILQVEFRDGSIYEYYEVPKNLFNELMKADSKGKFANQHIFYNYRYARV